MGFEPMTSCLLDRRSNQLSYGAICICYYSFIRIKHSEHLFTDVKGFDSLIGPVQANFEPLKEAVPFLWPRHTNWVWMTDPTTYNHIQKSLC